MRFLVPLLLIASAYGDQIVEVAPTNETRQYPGLALLPDGRVLATTGHPLGGKSLDSSEIYDPNTDTWTPTASLHTPRNGVGPQGLIPLPNGTFLIAGEGSHAESTANCEVYDVEAHVWIETGALSVGRSVHTLTLLDDGRVLAAGGIQWSDNTVHRSAEIYDHESGEWSPAGEMSLPRANHTAVRLGDGRVLVLGGTDNPNFNENITNTCEIFDPENVAWTMTDSMSIPRRSTRAVLLPDGRVLVAGGSNSFEARRPEIAECEIYDPERGTWSMTAPLDEGRWGPTLTVLNDGRVLAAGGMYGRSGRRDSTELYDPGKGIWTPGPNLHQARNGHRAIKFKDGRVLLVGGYSGFRYLSSCEIFIP